MSHCREVIEDVTRIDFVLEDIIVSAVHSPATTTLGYDHLQWMSTGVSSGMLPWQPHDINNG